MSHGPFDTLSIDRDHREVMLNVVALARLTHLVVPGMLARKDGIYGSLPALAWAMER